MKEPSAEQIRSCHFTEQGIRTVREMTDAILRDLRHGTGGL